jgi:transposase
MARRKMTMERHEEIKRLLALGMSLSKISTSLRCSRKSARLVRDGKRVLEAKKLRPPLWTDKLEWSTILQEVKDGHYIKHIWEERASEIINYSGFWKQFKKLYPEYQERFVTNRFFNPAGHCEVDYAGDKVEYVTRTGEVNKASIFVGILCYSQKLFAYAAANEKSRYFLESHAKMYENFGGVPEVTVCDCLKQGVKKANIFDPDLNEAYSDMAKYYNTAVVPARVRHPKDKALVEGAVKIIMRYFKFKNRNNTFRSVSEINNALRICVEEINNKKHTRLKISRNQMWLEHEKNKLKSLPLESYECCEWKECRVHPDSHICVWANYYSVPYIYRGKTVKVKISKSTIEIYYELERLALHSRSTSISAYTTIIEHLPKNAQAYYENTPQNVLSQAKFISKDLHVLIEDEFKISTLGNLRRAQGFVSVARQEVEAIGHKLAEENIIKTCSDIKMFSKFRVSYFKEQLFRYRKQTATKKDTEIVRKENHLLRHYQQQEFNNVLFIK